MEDLSGLWVFAKVVEQGSFSGAARQLGRSKAAVSKQIARLEERLGARLLNRTTRRLSLTDAGAEFYDRARRIIVEAEEAEAAVSRLSDQVRGRLRVNAPVTFGRYHLAPLIAAFMAAHPDLEVEVVLNDRMTDLVEEGFDVAIRIATLGDSSYIARLLTPSRRILVASPAYIKAAPAIHRLEDVAEHPCLIYSYAVSNPTHEWRMNDPEGKTHAVRICGRLTANNGEVLLEACKAGQGILNLPTFICGDMVKSGDLQQVLPGWFDQSGGIYAIWPETRHLSAKVRAFVDFLAERFAGKPYWEIDEANIP